MFKIVREPADMTALPPTEYSPGLERIVARALSKSVKDRYQSLEEMREDLERLVRETASRLLPAPPPAAPSLTEAERAEATAQIAQARAEGHLQKALTLARRLRDVGGDDAPARALVAEVEQAIREKEVEQLSGVALSYAADGDLDLARKIAAKVASLAPGSAKHRELAAYLDEETARQEAGALLATAQEHIAHGNLEEALAAAEQALVAQPDHALAREIRERASRVLRARDRAAATGVADGGAPPSRPSSPATAEATLTPIPAASPAEEPRPSPAALTPLPEGAPSHPEAAALVDAARRHLKERSAAKAVPLLEQAAALEPGHAAIAGLLAGARAEARKAEAAALTAAALNHFVRSDHARARKAVERALALEPANRKAQELLEILTTLG
jgi:hypothetical protein